MPVEKLTPERRRQMTRDALVDAASEVFVRRGFEGASLDEIAETAGFTRGAIYKHFDNKEDLFLAVFDRVNERVLGSFASLLDRGKDVFFDTHTLAGMWQELVADSDITTLQREFQQYESRNPELRARSEAQRLRNLEMVTQFIEENSAAVGQRLKLPAKVAAGILLSSSEGFALALQWDPGQVDLYEAFLELMIPALFEAAD